MITIKMNQIEVANILKEALWGGGPTPFFPMGKKCLFPFSPWENGVGPPQGYTSHLLLQEKKTAKRPLYLSEYKYITHRNI